MSREIRELSTEQVAKIIYARCCEYFGPGHEEMSITIIAQEIELLLAQEREKVRELCAVEILKRADELRDLLKTIEESCGPGDVDAETERVRMQNRAEELELVAAGIRQLDLTKDLAASSREEGKSNAR